MQLRMILAAPVFDNCVGGSGEPFRIIAKQLDSRRGKVFGSICGGMTERPDEVCANQNRDLVRSEAKPPSGFDCGEPGRSNSKVKEITAFGDHSA